MPAERAELLHLLQLGEEVLEGEAPLEQPGRAFGRDVVVELALGLLDEA